MIYPLAFICTSFLFGSLLTVMSDYREACYIMLAIIIVTITTAIILRKSKGLMLIFCLLFYLAGVLYTYGYSAVHTIQINNYYNNQVTAEGTICDTFTNGFVLNLNKINSNKIYGKININVYIYEDFEYNCGDNVVITGKLRCYKDSAYYGDFNARKFYMSDKTYGSISPENISIIKTGSNLFYKIRTSISKKITNTFTGDKGEFLNAMLTGDKSGFSETLKSNLMKSSLSHVSVISGMHLSILISFAGIFASFFKRKKLMYISVMLMFLGLFTAIIGQHPSILRAVIMASYCLFAAFLNKRYDPFTALTFSAVILIIINPFYAQSVSFQLSYAATFGIILCIDKQGKHVLLTTLCIFLVTLPLCMFYFNFASFAIFFTNLIITPVIAILLPLGYLIYIFPFLSIIADIMLEFILLVIEAFGSIDIFNIKSAVPTITELIALYSFVGAFISFIVFNKKKFAIAFLCFTLIFAIPSSMQPKSYIKIFNDTENVIHIKSPKGKNIICTSGYESVKSYANKLNIKQIDALILTKIPNNYNFNNLNISKIYAPKYSDKQINGNFSIKYYDTDKIILDGIVITPVSFMPYKSKIDEKRAVLHIDNGKTSVLFEPYVNDELNKEYLQSASADIVISKNDTSINKQYKIVIGSGLQATENMLYYDLDKCGSVTFYNNKTKTLR